MSAGIIDFPEDSGVLISGRVPPLHPRSWFEPPSVIQATLAPMNLIQIGAFTGIYGGKIGHCKIGRYCSIAAGVDIASDQHPVNWLSSSMLQYVNDVHGWGSWLKRHGYIYEPSDSKFNSNAQVVIGNDVWIGQGVFIKSGVTIGDGVVVAAHSVVIDDVPPYSIVAGVPAKIKKQRFEDQIVARLMELKWWEYNIMEFKGLDFGNIQSTLDLIADTIAAGRVSPYKPNVFQVGV